MLPLSIAILLLVFHSLHLYTADAFLWRTSLMHGPPLLRRVVHQKKLASKLMNGIELDGEVTPLHNNMFVKIKEVETTTAGGLHLPASTVVKPHEGKVVSVGPGKIDEDTGIKEPMIVQVGDCVIYGEYDGSEVMMNGHPHQLLSDEAVLLKYKGSAPPTLSSVACVRDHVLIKPTKKDEMSASGIIVRTTSQQDEENQRPDTGVVVQMGPGVQNKKTGVVEEIRGFGVGDSVMFRQYTTNPVKLDGQDYVIVRAVNILSKWTPAKK